MTGGFFFRIIEDRRRERERILLEREETEIFGNGGIRLNANARDQRATAIARHESNRANPSTREQASISIKVYIYIYMRAHPRNVTDIPSVPLIFLARICPIGRSSASILASTRYFLYFLLFPTAYTPVMVPLKGKY